MSKTTINWAYTLNSYIFYIFPIFHRKPHVAPFPPQHNSEQIPLEWRKQTRCAPWTHNGSIKIKTWDSNNTFVYNWKRWSSRGGHQECNWIRESPESREEKFSLSVTKMLWVRFKLSSIIFKEVSSIKKKIFSLSSILCVKNSNRIWTLSRNFIVEYHDHEVQSLYISLCIFGSSFPSLLLLHDYGIAWVLTWFFISPK